MPASGCRVIALTLSAIGLLLARPVAAPCDPPDAQISPTTFLTHTLPRVKTTPALALTELFEEATVEKGTARLSEANSFSVPDWIMTVSLPVTRLGLCLQSLAPASPREQDLAGTSIIPPEQSRLARGVLISLDSTRAF